MTLVLALGCTDGVVMAADSASTDLAGGTKQPTLKIRPFPNKGILFGASGDYGLLQKVFENMIDPPITAVKLKALRQALKQRFAQEVTLSTQYHCPQHPADAPPPCIALLAGVLEHKPFVLEFDKNATDTIFDDNLGSFNAIGSGKAFAQALFRPFLYKERDLEKAKVLAYKIIDDSINIAAFGLAAPVRISIVTLDGQISELSSPELESLAQTVQIWRELEIECLGKALSNSNVSSPQTIAIPEPEKTLEPSNTK